MTLQQYLLLATVLVFGHADAFRQNTHGTSVVTTHDDQEEDDDVPLDAESDQGEDVEDRLDAALEAREDADLKKENAIEAKEETEEDAVKDVLKAKDEQTMEESTEFDAKGKKLDQAQMIGQLELWKSKHIPGYKLREDDSLDDVVQEEREVEDANDIMEKTADDVDGSEYNPTADEVTVVPDSFLQINQDTGVKTSSTVAYGLAQSVLQSVEASTDSDEEEEDPVKEEREEERMMNDDDEETFQSKQAVQQNRYGLEDEMNILQQRDNLEKHQREVGQEQTDDDVEEVESDASAVGALN